MKNQHGHWVHWCHWIEKWFLLCEDHNTHESYYGSPPNFSLTKPPVLKPASGRMSWNTVYIDTPTSSFDSPLQNKEMYGNVLLLASFPVSSSRKTSVKENLWCLGGTIVESVTLSGWCAETIEQTSKKETVRTRYDRYACYYILLPYTYSTCRKNYGNEKQRCPLWRSSVDPSRRRETYHSKFSLRS